MDRAGLVEMIDVETWTWFRGVIGCQWVEKTCQAIEVHKARWWLRLCTLSLPLHGEMIRFG